MGSGSTKRCWSSAMEVFSASSQGQRSKGEPKNESGANQQSYRKLGGRRQPCVLAEQGFRERPPCAISSVTTRTSRHEIEPFHHSRQLAFTAGFTDTLSRAI